MNNKWIEKLEEDSALIAELGGFATPSLRPTHPGISIDTPGEGRMQLDTASWNWLRPLLEELINSRKNFQQMHLNVGKKDW